MWQPKLFMVLLAVTQTLSWPYGPLVAVTSECKNKATTCEMSTQEGTGCDFSDCCSTCAENYRKKISSSLEQLCENKGGRCKAYNRIALRKFNAGSEECTSKSCMQGEVEDKICRLFYSRYQFTDVLECVKKITAEEYIRVHHENPDATLIKSYSRIPLGGEAPRSIAEEDATERYNDEMFEEYWPY